MTGSGERMEGPEASSGPSAGRDRLRLPARLPAPVQWILLVAATALLLRWVEASVLESPYNGF